MRQEEYLWTEKYRPRTIEEAILPEDIKSTLLQYLSQGNVQNLILAGPPGTGKTTAARAILEELDSDYIVINGSMRGNIDTLRNEIQTFASAVSLGGGRKYVILDEADYLNINSTQPALRNFMEEYSKNCGFILTCNYKNKIMEPLRSRCTVIEFKIPKKEMPRLAMQFLKRAIYILEQEGIEYDKSVLAAVITKHIPDWRRVLNELQRYSLNGNIDSGILANVQDVSIKALVENLKNKNFTATRTWIAENMDNDAHAIFRTIYDGLNEYVVKSSIPAIVLILARYQYQSAFAADQEINMAACMIEIMMEAEWQ